MGAVWNESSLSDTGMHGGYFDLPPKHRRTTRQEWWAMKRSMFSFHDFDWVLFGLVMLMSVISVFEIYSATLHTKFAGFRA